MLGSLTLIAIKSRGRQNISKDESHKKEMFHVNLILSDTHTQRKKREEEEKKKKT